MSDLILSNDKLDDLRSATKSGKSLNIVRYNGSSHRHGDILYKCHIHIATAEALEAGKKIDNHAVATDKYRTVEGALSCLIDDCGVLGLSAQSDEPDLLDGN